MLLALPFTPIGPICLCGVACCVPRPVWIGPDVLSAVIWHFSLSESHTIFISLQAVALNCRYMRIGAPCHGEHTAKLNRLLEIETELQALEQLAQWDPQTFPQITAPVTPLDSQRDEAKTPRQEPNAKSEAKKK